MGDFSSTFLYNKNPPLSITLSSNKNRAFYASNRGGFLFPLHSPFGFRRIIILRDSGKVPGILAACTWRSLGGNGGLLAWGWPPCMYVLLNGHTDEACGHACSGHTDESKCMQYTRTARTTPCPIQPQTRLTNPFGNFLTWLGGFSARQKDPNKNHRICGSTK